MRKAVLMLVIGGSLLVACSGESGHSSVELQPPSVDNPTGPMQRSDQVLVDEGISSVESAQVTGLLLTDISQEPGSPDASSERYQLNWVNPNE